MYTWHPWHVLRMVGACTACFPDFQACLVAFKRPPVGMWVHKLSLNWQSAGGEPGV